MAGILDFILAQQGQKRAEARRAELEAALPDLLGRRPITLEGFDDIPAETVSPGSGLLADPGDPRRQAEFATGLLPFAPQIAGGLLQQITQQEGAGARQEAGDVAAGARQESANTAAMDRAQLQALVSRFNVQDQIQGRADIAAAGGALGGPQFGTVPPGEVMVPSPETGLPMLVPLEGSERNIKAGQSLRSLQQSVDNFEQFDTIFSDVGSEFFSATDARTMLSLRQLIISDVGILMELGVLQQGDLERVEGVLPDPTGFGGKARAGIGQNTAIRAGYNVFADLMRARLQDFQQATKFWPGLQDFQRPQLPPGTVPVEQQ